MQDLQNITSKYIKRNGMSIQRFADFLGVSRSLAGKWLCNEHRFNEEKIKNVLEFLDGKHWVTVNEILEEGERMNDR